MKISKSTLDVLKNFATIHTNMLFREGNVVRTISAAGNLFATAVVEEEFPKEFAIYDLNSLLALLSMTGDDDEVEFGEKALKITKGDGVFEYFYADADVIKAAPNKTINIDKVFTFKLSKGDVEMLTKAAAIVSAQTINFVARKGVAVISVGDPDTPGSNSFKRPVGKTKLEFDCRLAIENLRVIPLDYDVSLSAKKVVYFKNADRKIEYWLALDPKSSINASQAVEEETEEEEPAPSKKSKKK